MYARFPFSKFLLGLTLLVGYQFQAGATEPQLSGKLLVMAAASTSDVMDQVRTEFAKLHPAVTIRTSYGASSTLAQQIKVGAETDVFLSASVEWAEFLRKPGLVEKQRDLLGNQLVVIVPADSKIAIQSPADLAQAKIQHLALADPKSVPAGVYAKQALEALGLWTKVEGRVAGAADVRQALHFVETAAAEAGIVYATDAAGSKKVRVVLRIDPKLTEPIRYPLVLLKRASGNAAAGAFYDFLSSEAASDIFRKAGFVVLDAREK